MSRFVTPAKIGLLALIQVYAEGVVPDDAALSVLSFVISHVIDGDLAPPSPSSRWDKTEAAVRFIVSIDEFERLLDSRGLWDNFLGKLWAIDSLDALFAFFEDLPNLLAKSKEELKVLAEMGVPPPPEDAIRLRKSSPFSS